MKKLLQNKHKFIAIIMAPFLAIGGYGLADLYMNKKEDAKYYQLVPKGSCKPVQDACEIEGRGLTLNVKFGASPQSNQALPVTVTSKDRLDDVALSILSNGVESDAVGASHNDRRTVWNTAPQLKAIGDSKSLVLRLVISEQGRMHFVETPLVIDQ